MQPFRPMRIPNSTDGARVDVDIVSFLHPCIRMLRDSLDSIRTHRDFAFKSISAFQTFSHYLESLHAAVCYLKSLGSSTNNHDVRGINRCNVQKNTQLFLVLFVRDVHKGVLTH